MKKEVEHYDLTGLFEEDQILAVKDYLKNNKVARRNFEISMQKLDQLVAERQVPEPQSHFLPSGVWRVPALEAFFRQLLP